MAHYDGSVFVPERPVSAKINQEAIIILLEPLLPNIPQKEHLLDMSGKISHREDYLEMSRILDEITGAYLNE